MSKYSQKEDVVEWPKGLDTSLFKLEVEKQGKNQIVKVTIKRTKNVKFFPLTNKSLSEILIFLGKNLVFKKKTSKNKL